MTAFYSSTGAGFPPNRVCARPALGRLHRLYLFSSPAMRAVVHYVWYITFLYFIRPLPSFVPDGDGSGRICTHGMGTRYGA